MFTIVLCEAWEEEGLIPTRMQARSAALALCAPCTRCTVVWYARTARGLCIILMRLCNLPQMPVQKGNNTSRYRCPRDQLLTFYRFSVQTTNRLIRIPSTTWMASLLLRFRSLLATCSFSACCNFEQSGHKGKCLGISRHCPPLP